MSDTSVDFPLDSNAFGVKGPKPEEVAPKQEEVAAEAKAEPVAPKGDEKPVLPAEKAEEDTSTEEDRELRRKAQEAHNVVIEMIGEKFQAFQDGTLSETQLKTWFEEHPTIAEKANRSKKYKDDFRTLMEAKKDEPAKAVEPSKNEDEEEDDSGKFMTRAEMKSLLQEHAQEMEERLVEKRLQSERTSLAQTFAAKYNVKDEEFEKLKKNAEAILSVNEELEYETALERAYGVLHPEKPKPASGIKSDNGKDVPDAKTEVEKIMQQHGLTKEIAEELVAQGKTAATVNLAEGIPLMAMKSLR